MPSQYYHFISKVQLFFTWVNTYSGSLDWHAPRQRKLVHWQWCGVRIGVGGADSAFRVVYGQQRKSLFTFPLSFLSSRTVLHPQCLHLPFFFSQLCPSISPASSYLSFHCLSWFLWVCRPWHECFLVVDWRESFVTLSTVFLRTNHLVQMC